MKRILPLVLLLSVGLIAGCAASKKAAQPHPLVGLWDYSVDTGDAIYTGVVNVVQGEDGFSGTITNEAVQGSMGLMDLVVEENHVSFEFDSGQYGVISFNGDIMDNKLEGVFLLDEYGEMPVTGQKKMSEM